MGLGRMAELTPRRLLSKTDGNDNVRRNNKRPRKGMTMFREIIAAGDARSAAFVPNFGS